MENKYCFYSDDGYLHKIPMEGVRYLESEGNYVKFHGRSGYDLARLPFVLVLDLLYSEKLIQIHRSYAIFIEHVIAIGPKSVVVDTLEPTEIPLTKKYRPKLMDHISILKAGSNGCGSDCDPIDGPPEIDFDDSKDVKEDKREGTRVWKRER